MKCPYCLLEIFDDSRFVSLCHAEKVGYAWGISYQLCPNCKNIIVDLVYGPGFSEDFNPMIIPIPETYTRIWPKESTRSTCPLEVPKKYANDYMESCLVLTDSPKASAALSRRCLQSLMRDEAGSKPDTLFNEIQKAIDKEMYPSYIRELLDTVRVVGNFATHPIKNQNTGEITEVEPVEAELLLDVLESLFDFYFVQPAVRKRQKDRINEKLIAAGKSPMKLQ
jgi:hypothetical protein